MNAPSLMRLMPLLVLTASLSGCISYTLLSTEHTSIQSELARARTLTFCAPEALALAEANLKFAEIEFQQGDPRRAARHLQVARENLRVANACPPVPIKPKDSDGDGIVDTEDICVNDVEDLDGYKDSDGCPDLDNDMDSIYDSQDGCPMDAEDRDGTADSDGCPDLDNDGDGLADLQDGCPNEPGPPELRGCPVRDRDNDGISDNVDQCPDQAENKNDYLDDDGCVDVKPSRVEITADQIVIKQRINFATGKATILSDSYPVLDDVIQVLRDYPTLRVEIGGHTDNVGDDNANQRLSKARADSVFEYFITRGIEASRMTTVGYGESRPIDTNKTESGRLNNRRVEFVILK